MSDYMKDERTIWYCQKCGGVMRAVQLSPDYFEMICDRCNSVEDKIMESKFK